MVQNLRINKDEFTEEQINQLIEDNNITIKLTNKRKKLLAVLLHLNGLDNKDEQGRFFIDNLWLSQFVGMTETNMLIALRYLQRNGIIERETGSNHNCSRYKIINKENNSTNQKTVVQNNSRDRDIELDKDIDIESDSESYKNSESDIYNIINNIIKDNINNLINIIEEKENNIINIIKEKEKTSSIENNNKKEKDTLMEVTLQEQINQLQQQNEILTSRINNAAKQFKAMINTMRELQQKNNSLEEQNKPSTTFSNEVVEGIKEQSPTVKEQTPTVQGNKNKEQVKTIDVEEILEYFKATFTDPKVARQRENKLLKEFKEARVSYYTIRDLELRLNKYIKSLELINSNKQEVKEPIEEEVKKEETIPTVQVEVAQVPIQEELKELPQEAVKEVEAPIVSGKEEEATEGKESTFVESFQEVKSDSPIGEERLRYQDLKTKVYYPSLEEAKAANVNPMFLYDREVNRSVFSYQ